MANLAKRSPRRGLGGFLETSKEVSLLMLWGIPTFISAYQVLKIRYTVVWGS
ncbi:Uncharacterized protein FKW44_000856 [Caligus rogercresseyi]|uniref:Uncharacterized protein n=1 Tax=Caligus rogercresseyi TaxID=217165 RepID=A0A7T8QV81_CALRO|nr:Uncharacterized protein FKW44_000856 [Caligus rogercresseyi]